MKSISPGLEKISEMISAKTGNSGNSIGKDNFGKGMLKNKKKKHLNFNFMKSSKV